MTMRWPLIMPMRRALQRHRLFCTSSPHASTLKWVDEMIIGRNLCPYTRAVRKRDTALRAIVCEPDDDEALLANIDSEVHALASGDGETSLLVVSPSTPWGRGMHEDFARWLSLGWKVEDRLADLAPTTLQLPIP